MSKRPVVLEFSMTIHMKIVVKALLKYLLNRKTEKYILADLCFAPKNPRIGKIQSYLKKSETDGVSDLVDLSLQRPLY